MTAADDRALVERLRAKLRDESPDAWYVGAPEVTRLLALAERGLSERADVVAWLRADTTWRTLKALVPETVKRIAEQIERGAHEGAARRGGA